MRIIQLALHWIFFPKQFVPKPEWLGALECLGKIEHVQVERDGRPICCLSITRPDTPSLRGVALLLHPITRYAKYFFTRSQHVQTYLDLGYRVVVMDLNGFGESEFNDFRYWQDIIAVTSELRNRFPERSFVVHGFSFSGFHLIPAIHRFPDNAKIVIENIYDSFYGYWRKWLITRCIAWVLEKLRISWIREMNIKKALADLDRQDVMILFVACGQDPITPVANMRNLLNNLKVPHQFEVFDRAGHLKAIESEPDRYRKMIAKLVDV